MYFSTPNTFTTNTTIFASKVNSNFSAVQSIHTAGYDLNVQSINVSQTTRVSAVLINSGIAFNDNIHMAFYRYSHIITSGDIANGYATIVINQQPISSIVAAHVTGYNNMGAPESHGEQTVKVLNNGLNVNAYVPTAGCGVCSNLFVEGRKLCLVIIKKG